MVHALGRERPADLEFDASLVYRNEFQDMFQSYTEKTCLEKPEKKYLLCLRSTDPSIVTHVPVLRRWGQEGYKFVVSFSYRVRLIWKKRRRGRRKKGRKRKGERMNEKQKSQASQLMSTIPALGRRRQKQLKSSLGFSEQTKPKIYDCQPGRILNYLGHMPLGMHWREFLN